MLLKSTLSSVANSQATPTQATPQPFNYGKESNPRRDLDSLKGIISFFPQVIDEEKRKLSELQAQLETIKGTEPTPSEEPEPQVFYYIPAPAPKSTNPSLYLLFGFLGGALICFFAYLVFSQKALQA